MTNDPTPWADFSAREFERFCRDLLARRLGTHVEIFTAPDGGRDLRAQAGQIIIQCKRYTTKESDLLAAMRKEAAKEAVRKAQRYILMTSLRLSDKARRNLRTMIPSLREEGDILDHDDITRLLQQYPDIRELYPPLWANDDAFIRRIRREWAERATTSENAIEMGAVIDSMQYFVCPPQTETAMQKLCGQRALIITGPPGAGKTMLARHLIWRFVHEEGYEPIVLNGTADDALPLHKPGVKQLFLYDDFLGSTFLYDQREKNESRKLHAFISRVRASEDKLVILTTREYIFRQAKQTPHALSGDDEFYAPLILPLCQSSLRFRAELLRRHLLHAHVSTDQIETLFYNPHGERWGSNYYLKRILQHPSFNPRLIAAALGPHRRETEIVHFPSYLCDALDTPYFLYENAFISHLAQGQRHILLTLATYPDGLSVKELLPAVLAYEGYSSAALRPASLENDLRVLIGDFLSSDCRGGDNIFIRFANPGVRDFLHAYLERHPSVFETLFCAADSTEQLLHLSKILYRARLAFPQDTKQLFSMRCAEHLREKTNNTWDLHLRAELLNHISSEFSRGLFSELATALINEAAQRNEGGIPDDAIFTYREILNTLVMYGKTKQPWDDILEAVFRGSSTLWAIEFAASFDKRFSLRLVNPDSPSPAAAQWLNAYMWRMEYADEKETEDELDFFEECFIDYKPRYCGIDFNALHKMLRRCLRYERREAALSQEEEPEPDEPTEDEDSLIRSVFEPQMPTNEPPS